MRISDWSSDVCSSDLDRRDLAVHLDRRRHPGRDEQVRRLLVRHQFEARGEVDAATLWLLRCRGLGIGDWGFGEARWRHRHYRSCARPGFYASGIPHTDSRLFTTTLLLRVILRLRTPP